MYRRVRSARGAFLFFIFKKCNFWSDLSNFEIVTARPYRGEDVCKSWSELVKISVSYDQNKFSCFPLMKTARINEKGGLYKGENLACSHVQIQDPQKKAVPFGNVSRRSRTCKRRGSCCSTARCHAPTTSCVRSRRTSSPGTPARTTTGSGPRSSTSSATRSERTRARIDNDRRRPTTTPLPMSYH